jgi:isoprenylcysteine carboxyl methyltransferase (ICMT) family protein YpbQ
LLLSDKLSATTTESKNQCKITHNKRKISNAGAEKGKQPEYLMSSVHITLFRAVLLENNLKMYIHIKQ